MRLRYKVALLIVTALICRAVAFAVSVSVNPTTVQVQPGGQTQFSATVGGTTNSVVVWSLSGVNCGGVACGQITNTGLYLAPATAPNPDVVTVTATSLADLTASGSAAVIVGTSSDVKVTLSPTTANVLIGQQQTFVAFVSGTTLTGVNWSLSGGSCAQTGCGMITPSGVYTAPGTQPAPAQVTVTATSVADPSKSASSIVTVSLPVSVSVSPTSTTVNAGLQKQLTATVLNTTNTAVTWKASGAGCSGATCGAVSSTGVYSAPSTPPTPAQVSVTATSVADTTKSAASIVTVSPAVGVSVLPTSAQVLTGAKQQFTATVTNTTNTAVNWSVAGTGCSGTSCGTITSAGLYSAPAIVPSPPQVFVTATSAADPTKSATASVTVIAPVAVSVSPPTARVVVGSTQQFTATVTNATNTSVTWGVSGSGCSGSACGTITSSGLYTAPAHVPTPAQITVTATSVADITKSATATVTVAPPVAVAISPTSVTLLIGGTQQFTATVTNSTNTAVTWSLAGTGCTGSACGTITSNGLYTAPGSVPSPPAVFVTATSVADPTKSATASVTIGLPISVTVTPSTATVPLAGKQQFTATVAHTTNTAVAWTLSGSGCTGSSCGTISATGLYAPPRSVPVPPQVTVKATSSADPTKSGTALVTVTLAVAISISPTSATIPAGEQKQFTATVTNTSNTAVSWTVTGAGCSGSACGVVSSTGLYTAPSTIPSPALVSVTATSAADSTKSAAAAVTIVPPVLVTVSPASAQVVTGTKQQFTATVKNTTNTAVTWSLSGSCNGSACGTITSAGLYTAPGTVPNPALVVVTATSVADPTRSGTASVTVIPPVSVTISPIKASVPVSGRQQFLATVNGTTNNSVTWSVSGSGCTGTACGVVSATGVYTAPAAVPSPAQVSVKVTSAADTTRSATATVTVVPPVAVKISPTSIDVAVGKTEQFTATVTGSTNTSVTWSVTGNGCTGTACGTISTTGLYTAPSAIPTPPDVTVTATSVADTTKSANATVTVIPPVAVSVSPTSIQVVTGNQQQFTSTVTGSSNTSVTWSLKGSGCSGATCGTITSAGLYTAPAKVPNPAQVVVTAKSQADTTKTGTATVTVIPPVSVTISPTNATVSVGSTQQFQSTVTGSTNTAVIWSVSGAGCSGSACGTVSSTGLYQAPASLPSTSTVIVKASAQIDVAQSASATVSIVANPNSKLDGGYAFQFTGFDSNGTYQATGSFTADGNGNITSGLEDVSDTNGVTTGFAISGTYSVTGDNRGVLNLSTASGSQVFRFALNIAGTKARFIEFDSTGIRGSGVFEQQDPSAFSVSALKGAYVLRLSGSNSGGARIGALGLLYFDGTGNIFGGSMDVNNGGTVKPTFASFSGVYRVDPTGRGTANLTIPGFLGGGFRFAFYVVSAEKQLYISIDQLSAKNPLFSGPAELQLGAPFASSILSGPTVFSLAGEQGGTPQVLVGRIVFDGVSEPLTTFNQNTGGSVTTISLTGAYSVGITGTGALDLDDSNGHSRVWDVYVIGPNHAFMMDVSTAEVETGELNPQVVLNQYSSADILGSYLLGSGEPLVSIATLVTGVSTFDGKSKASGTVDISQSESLTPGESLAGTYSVSTSANDGSGKLTLTYPSGQTFAVWVTDPNQVVALEIDNLNSKPTVLFFEQ